MLAAPVALTANACASHVSASSTAVQAAALTTTSCPRTAARQAGRSVTSSADRGARVTSCPASARTAVRSWPSIPADPVTSHRVTGATPLPGGGA